MKKSALYSCTRRRGVPSHSAPPAYQLEESVPVSTAGAGALDVDARAQPASSAAAAIHDRLAIGQQPVHDGGRVNRRRIEHGDRRRRTLAKDERELRPPENDSLDTVALAHPLGDLDEPSPRFVLHDAVAKLAEVLLMHVLLLVGSGGDHGNAGRLEGVVIEPS